MTTLRERLASDRVKSFAVEPPLWKKRLSASLSRPPVDLETMRSEMLRLKSVMHASAMTNNVIRSAQTRADVVVTSEAYKRAKNAYDVARGCADRSAVLDAQESRDTLAELVALKDVKVPTYEPCKKCQKPVNDFRATTSCGCSYHRDCLVGLSASELNCVCGMELRFAVVGRRFESGKPLPLRSPLCLGCRLESNYYSPLWPNGELDDYPCRELWPYEPGRGYLCPPRHQCAVGQKLASTQAHSPSLRSVPFPVVDSLTGDVELWLASTRCPPGFSPGSASVAGHHVLYGATPTLVLSFPLKVDIYLFRVEPFDYKVGKITCIESAPVSGRSYEIAVYMASEGDFSGNLRVPVTGAVEGDCLLCPASALEKEDALGIMGYSLAYPSLASTYPIFFISDVKKGIFPSGARTNEVYTVPEGGSVLWEPPRVVESLDPSPPELAPSLESGELLARAMDTPEKVGTARVKLGGKETTVAYVGERPPTKVLRQLARDTRGPTRIPIGRLQPKGTDAQRKMENKPSIAQFNEMKNKLKEVRGELRALSTNIRASAADETFTMTGRSKYLRSVLLPDEGAVTIPDNVMRLHHSKSETVTYNIDVASSGGGIFFLYPNHPTSLVGYHYIYDPVNGYVFDRSLSVAQNLRDNYDYGKRTSQLLTLRSSTLPSGVYALNGTFNAIRLEGTITEMPGLSSTDLYNSILTNTVDPLDKIGNVLVGDGLALLSLFDSFGQPYTRLADSSPSTLSFGTSVAVNQITDRGQDLSYEIDGTSTVDLANDTVTVVWDCTTNVDSSTGVQIALNILFSNMPVDQAMSYTAQYELLDPFGAPIITDAFAGDVTSSHGGQVSAGGIEFVTPPETSGPLGAVRLTVSVICGAPIPALSMGLTASYLVPTGARSGINTPLNVVAYQGVAPGSVITLSGWTNFDLVPNPVLRQNLGLTYGHVDIGEQDWCRTVLGDRKTFDLRSVWNLKDYQMARPLLAELADTTVHERAQALSAGDLIGALKRLFRPALAAIKSHPIGNRVLGGVRGAFPELNVVLGDSASGAPVTRMGTTLGRIGLACDDELAGCVARAMDGRVDRTDRSVKKKNSRQVAFPVILTQGLGDVIVGAQLYVCTDRPFGVVNPVRARTADGFFVQGLERVDGVAIRTGTNLYLTPIDPAKFALGQLKPVRGPVVVGHSCDSAMWLVVHGTFNGLLPFAVTGGEHAGHCEVNPAFAAKQAYLRPFMISLGGNSPDADIIIEDLRVVQPAVQPRGGFRGR